MKKFIYCLSIIFIALVLFSCKSKDVSSEDTDVTDVLEENVTDNENEENQADENIKNDAKKGFIGWIDTGKKNPSYENGLVKITTNSKLGTFCIFAVDYSGKSYPVLSSLNEYTSSSFYLKTGRKIFKLSANDKVKTGITELENGIKIIYSINDVATIFVEITAFSSASGKNTDTLKFNITVKNTGKRSESFALKAVLDTILGENDRFHFYNSKGNPVKNEALFRSMEEDKWFLSKNEKAAMQILLDGGDITSPEIVSLVNYKKLENSKWLPTEQYYGAFDTVLSYNNSAVAIVWPDQTLSPEGSSTTTFYISVALDGMIPNGYKYVYGIKTPESEKKPEISVPDKKDNNLTKVDFTAESEEISKEPEEIDSKVDDNNVVTDSVQTEMVTPEEISIPNIEFNVENISKDHLTTEYIQSLIDRIAELEKAGSSANRGEILQLNAELDAILSILR